MEAWLQSGYLLKHQATADEVRRLSGVVDRDLRDSAVPGSSDAGRFKHRDNAALQLYTVALLAAG